MNIDMIYNRYKLKKIKIIPENIMRIKISKGKIKSNRKIITIKSDTYVQIEQLTNKEVKNEEHISTRDSNVSFFHPCRLIECCMESNSTLLPYILVLGSVIVKSSSGDVYQEEKDYKVSYKWPCVWTLETGKIKDKEKIFIDYKYSLARIDTIYVMEDGTVGIKKGVEKRESPKPPELDKDCIPLANVYLPYNTNTITEQNIYPIGQLPKVTEKELKQKSKYVKKTLEKLKNGQPVKIVFWGDSVTEGGDARPLNKAFAYLFPQVLQEKFPKSRIEAINKGIGGTNTDQRLPNFKKDVIDNNPDLVIIEFINDTGFSIEKIYENYTEIIGELKKIGSEIIIITPHIPLEGLYCNFFEAVNTWRLIAKSEKIGLCDVTKAWANIALKGIPPQSLLYNGINHPDNDGHKIFVDELMNFFL